jgi:hypothetical protein
MLFKKLNHSLVLMACASVALAMASGCAADPPAPAAKASPPAATAPAADAKPAAPVGTSPEAKTEADAATNLEKKFQEAARSYSKVQKNGETMYCKKEKPIGSTVPRMQCINEAQLRLQVEQMDELRERMRNSSRCTRGPGCSSGT